MRETLARIGSWGRRALILGALIGAPMLAAAPAAEAAARAPNQAQAAMLPGGEAAPADLLVPAQYYGPPPRRYYDRGPRHGYRYGPPPRGYYRRHHAWHRGYPPPPPRHYRRHWRGY